LRAPQAPAAWLKRAERFDLLLIGSLLDAPQHPRVHFDRFLAEQARLPRSVGVIIGPEGDFSPAEYAAFQKPPEPSP
jgi:16S rRNA (uracil1498-N3)-methyltransferase